MKAACLIISLLAAAPELALADSFVTCRDPAGHELFAGYLDTGAALEPGEFHELKGLPYASAVSADPIGLDRATFTRLTSLDLKACLGPYAKIYEKLEAGQLRCASGEIKPLDVTGDDDAAILGALGVAPSEIPCSVILPKDKIKGLSSGQ